MGDRPNCESSESRVMRAVALKSEQLRPSIRDNHLQNSVQAEYTSNIDSNIFLNDTIALSRSPFLSVIIARYQKKIDGN
jgi:hypothetical protein